MIVVLITGIRFRRASGAVLKDCRRRVEQVEIKSAPLVRLSLLTHRGAQSVRGPRSGYTGTSRREEPPALASSSATG